MDTTTETAGLTAAPACPVCRGTGIVECPEPDGTGTYETACPEPACPVRICEVDGDHIDTYGGEHYWRCGRPGVLDVDGTWMCEDHAGEQGYGPKQEEYGFDPHDGLNPTPANGG